MEDFIFTGDDLLHSILFIREDRINNTLKEEDLNYNINNRRDSIRKPKISDEYIRIATIGSDTSIHKKHTSKRLAHSLYALYTNMKCRRLLGDDFFSHYIDIEDTEVSEKPKFSLRFSLSEFKVYNKSVAFVIYLLSSFHYINNLVYYHTEYKGDSFRARTKYNKNYFLYPRIIDNFLLHSILTVLKLVNDGNYSPISIIENINKIMKEYHGIFTSYQENTFISSYLKKDSKISRIYELTTPIKYEKNKDEIEFYKLFKQFETFTENEIIDIIEILKTLFSNSCPKDQEWEYIEENLFLSKNRLENENSKLINQSSNAINDLDYFVNNIHDARVEILSRLLAFKDSKTFTIYKSDNLLKALLEEITFFKKTSILINSSKDIWLSIIKDIATFSEKAKHLLKDNTTDQYIFDKIIRENYNELNNSLKTDVVIKELNNIINDIYRLFLIKEPQDFFNKFNQLEEKINEVLKDIHNIHLGIDNLSLLMHGFYDLNNVWNPNLMYNNELEKHDEIHINSTYYPYNQDSIKEAFKLLDLIMPNNECYDAVCVITRKFTEFIEQKYLSILKKDFNTASKIEIINSYRRLIDCENFISQTKFITYNKNIINLLDTIKNNNKNINKINIEFFQSKLNELKI
ncbi:MAG: hypothetical protein E6Y02_04920 [Gemella haemolysans]|uniref:hypothetical protein n=1 Tax=Gemella haemolysans TaxID=1379 RepID=UPI00291473CB|nr:hypothetical protein [Gemella haemolysans]MDU4714315.1 hypothetical protein [Gemella haemolysans]